MDPLSILSVLGTSVTITKSISEILDNLVAQTQNADRSLLQLRREVVDFENLLQRMSDDLTEPSMQITTLETHTGNVGAHWKAVRHAIRTCNKRLEELKALLDKLNGTSSTHNLMSSKLVKGIRLNFAESDIQFYRSEIKDYRDNIALTLQMIVVCRVMDNRLAPTTTQPDLVATENEIRRLRKGIRDIRISEGAVTSAEHYSQINTPEFSVKRKQVPNKAEDTVSPSLNSTAIWNRRLETANAIEPTLDYASVLISTASTYLPDRLSLDDERRIQNAHTNPAVLSFIEDQSGNVFVENPTETVRKRESDVRTALLLVPRAIASLFLMALFLIAWSFTCVILPFWAVYTILTVFTRLNKDKVKIEKNSKGVLNWFDKMHRYIWY